MTAQTVMTLWRATGWWQVIAPDGSLWRETSDEAEARGSMRDGDRLYQQWRRTETEWRPVDAGA